MKVYVVIEEDRGCGPMVCGVFASRGSAEAYVDGSSRMWIVEEEVRP